jgi:transcriptional regulator with XRE-family HTH domain
MLQTKRLMMLFSQHPNQVELRKRIRERDIPVTWDTLWDIIDLRKSPNIQLLEMLADVFEVDVAYFVDSRYADEAEHPQSLEAMLASLHLSETFVHTLETSLISLSDKLTLLLQIEGVRHGRRLMMSTIAAQMRNQGITVSPAYLLRLVNGKMDQQGNRSNPSLAIINGFAQIFGVDIAYFLNSRYALVMYVLLQWKLKVLMSDSAFFLNSAMYPNGTAGLAPLISLLDTLENAEKSPDFLAEEGDAIESDHSDVDSYPLDPRTRI